MTRILLILTALSAALPADGPDPQSGLAAPPVEVTTLD